MAGFVIANAAPPDAASEAACVCISVVTARLAAGLRSEPCEPEVKCTQVPMPAPTALNPGAAVLTKGAAAMRRCVAVFGMHRVVQHLRHGAPGAGHGRGDVVERIAGIDDRLRVAEELLVERRARAAGLSPRGPR